MSYKKSRYNVVIDSLENGCILLYNTYTGFLGIMDPKTKETYENIESIDIASIKDAELKNNCQTLIRHGYIVDYQVDELATFQLQRANARIGRNVLALTIAPTMSCNMRCPYCYENKNDKIMNEEVQDKLVEFVKAHFLAHRDINRLSITWYGGEPLLQKNTIYKLSSIILQLCKDNNITYDASIITNGSLLDKETAWKLYNDCKVDRVQITIDGMAELHNQRRIFADGRGSFDLILRNIEDCRSFMNISIRMNVDRSNVEEVDKFLKFAIEEKGWSNNPRIYIAPVDSYTENCGCSSSACFSGADFAEIKTNFQKMNYSINRNRVINEFFPRRTVLHCSAERQNNYVIDPDGNCYTCWMVIGDERYRTGHIDKPFAVTTNHYKWLSNELPQKCKDCEYLPLCAGGCGYFRVIKDGEPSCAKAYYSYKETLRLAYKDYLEQKACNDNI